MVGYQGQLQGILSLGKLIRSLTTAGHKPYFHARSLLARITAQKASDIMDKYVVYARKEEHPNKVLARMLDNHIKEIPVVDEDKKIIANIGIIELWKLVEKGGF